jgi:hypothetical protein
MPNWATAETKRKLTDVLPSESNGLKQLYNQSAFFHHPDFCSGILLS